MSSIFTSLPKQLEAFTAEASKLRLHDTHPPWSIAADATSLDAWAALLINGTLKALLLYLKKKGKARPPHAIDGAGDTSWARRCALTRSWRMASTPSG